MKTKIGLEYDYDWETVKESEMTYRFIKMNYNRPQLEEFNR